MLPLTQNQPTESLQFLIPIKSLKTVFFCIAKLHICYYYHIITVFMFEHTLNSFVIPLFSPFILFNLQQPRTVFYHLFTQFE